MIAAVFVCGNQHYYPTKNDINKQTVRKITLRTALSFPAAVEYSIGNIGCIATYYIFLAKVALDTIGSIAYHRIHMYG